MRHHSLNSFTYKTRCGVMGLVWLGLGMGSLSPVVLHAQESHAHSHSHVTAHISKHTPQHILAHSSLHHQQGLHQKLNKKKSVHNKVKTRKSVNPVATGTASVPAPVKDAVPAPVAAQPAPALPEKGTVTGLPVPRFLALRADVVNMRAGPGMRYPIQWIYHRRHMPVMVLREFDVWRLIQDADGQKGWVQQAILTGERYFITVGQPMSVMDDTKMENAGQTKQAQDKSADTSSEHMDSVITGYVANLQSLNQIQPHVIVRKEPKETAEPVAVLNSGVIGSIKECPINVNWCKVSIKAYIGWVPRKDIWGLLPQEIIQSH